MREPRFLSFLRCDVILIRIWDYIQNNDSVVTIWILDPNDEPGKDFPPQK